METSGQGQPWEDHVINTHGSGTRCGAELSGGPSRGAAGRPHLSLQQACSGETEDMEGASGVAGAVALGGALDRAVRDAVTGLFSLSPHCAVQEPTEMTLTHHTRARTQALSRPGDVEEDSGGVNVDLVVRSC